MWITLCRPASISIGHHCAAPGARSLCRYRAWAPRKLIRFDTADVVCQGIDVRCRGRLLAGTGPPTSTASKRELGAIGSPVWHLVAAGRDLRRARRWARVVGLLAGRRGVCRVSTAANRKSGGLVLMASSSSPGSSLVGADRPDQFVGHHYPTRRRLGRLSEDRAWLSRLATGPNRSVPGACGRRHPAWPGRPKLGSRACRWPTTLPG